MNVALSLVLVTTIVPVGRGAGYLAVADVNGDDRPDIIVANTERTPYLCC
jgi:FG-GAP repeat protein